MTCVRADLREIHLANQRQTSSHEVWRCPCGQHQVWLPTGIGSGRRGMVGKAVKALSCLPEGWL